MNIGMILDNSFPPDPRVENEASTLIGAGHKVYLYCFDHTHDQPVTEEINGIVVHRYRTPEWYSKASALAYTVPLYHYHIKKSIRNFIRKYAIEALHVHDMQVARAVFQLNESFQLPVVLDLHENRPEIMKFYPHVRSLIGRLTIFPEIWKKFEAKYMKKATHTVVVTEEAKQHYVNQFRVSPGKIRVVPNTVRKSFYTNYQVFNDITSAYRNNFTILYVGETGLRRGLLTLLAAVTHLVNAIPHLKVVIVGKSRTDHVLRNYVEQYDLHNYVDLEGWQHFERFPSYIMASNVCVCPIHRNIHHDTTFANKLFQYVSLEKPVVVSNCTAQENFVNEHECGLVFRDRDEQELASHIRYLHDHPDEAGRLGRNGKQAVKAFYNWEYTSRSLTTLYNNLI